MLRFAVLALSGSATPMRTTFSNDALVTEGKPIRIGHCIHGLGLGGAQQVIKYIVSGSDRRVFEHFVYSGKDGVFRREVEQAGARVATLRRWIPKLDPIWALRLARAMRRDGIDIVHTHLFGDSLHGYLAAKARDGLPVIMTLHNAKQNFSKLQLWAYRQLLPRSTRVVACSASARDSFADIVEDAAVSMCTITNGFDATTTAKPTPQALAALKNSLGIPADALVVGAIGRMVEQKGFNYLISAFRALHQNSDRELRLVLLGSGTDLHKLQRQARSEGLGDTVLFPGFRSDAREILAIFDIVAFPSLFEGLPVALLEAMAAASCIVATNIDSLAEVLEHQRTALLVPPRDPPALARMLALALADPELRRRLGSSTREIYLEQFTASRMVRSYESLYRSIIDGSDRDIARLSGSQQVAQGSA